MQFRSLALLTTLLAGACTDADDVAFDDTLDAGSPTDAAAPRADAGTPTDDGVTVTITLPDTGETMDVRFTPPSTVDVVRPPARLRVRLDAPMDEHIESLPGTTRAETCAAFVPSATTPELLITARQIWGVVTSVLEYGPRDPRIAALVADRLAAAGVTVAGPLVLRWPALEPATAQVGFGDPALAPIVPAANIPMSQTVAEVDRVGLHGAVIGALRFDETKVFLRIATVCDLENGAVTVIGASAPDASIVLELGLR